MKKKLLAVLACAVLALGLAACSQQPKEQEPQYADETAMSVIAKGLQARSDNIDAQEQKELGSSSMTAGMKEAVQTEIDADKELKSAQFKDSKLQENVLAYLNVLDDSMDVLENNATSSADFYTKWQEVYDKRTSLLKTFVEEYGLTVGEKYQSTLEELVANGTAAAKKSEQDEAVKSLVSSIVFEKVDDGYGNFTYQATVENTTGLDLSNVGIVLGLYDDEGVRAGEGYANATSWKAGEKVKLEAYASVDAAKVTPEVQYYEVED